MHSIKSGIGLPSTTHYSQNIHKLSLYYSLTLTIVFLSSLMVRTISLPVYAQSVETPVTEVEKPYEVLYTKAPEPLSSPATQSPDVVTDEGKNLDPIEQRQSIKGYIYELFGQNGRVAYGISIAEGKAKKRYNGEIVYDTAAVRKTDHELSIGIFQINLRSKVALVHWNRIPGQTEEEKIRWLQDPYNNVLVAHWIYSTHGNFDAWTTFSSGKYLAFVR